MFLHPELQLRIARASSDEHRRRAERRNARVAAFRGRGSRLPLGFPFRNRIGGDERRVAGTAKGLAHRAGGAS